MVEVAGWAGAVLILIGYMLLTAGKVDARTPLYQWMNVVGAAGFIINGAYHGAMPSAILNIIWMGIGLTALWRIGRSSSSTQ
jgi:hypothetical protein